MTVRDKVWDEVMTTLVNRGKFKISDLPFDDSTRHTVQRVLREMEEKGWVRRDSPHAGIWRVGSKAELLLNLSDETIENSKD